MSVVYLAEHLRLGRKVAFKVLAPHLAEDPGFRERFIRESRIAAGLDHPNIVTVYDAGEIGGLLYISMRYVEGSDLGRVLTQDGAIDPWRTLTIVSQVGSALDAAHTEGLVHRDVKPGNILLSQPDSSVERAFLSDFGVTKRMTSTQALTRTGGFVGTVDYVAPEQIQDQPVDGRADVYSLGCVIYQCLSGRIPFPRPTEIATIYAHIQDETPQLPEGTYPAMNPVIARALAKDKDDRYPTCTALVEAARSNIHGNAPTDVHTKPDAIAADTKEMQVPLRPRRRRPAWIVAAAIVVVAGITTLTIALAGLDHGVGAPPASPSGSATTGPSALTRLYWVTENRSVFAHASGQTAFTNAITIPGPDVIAIGHADDPTEDAVVWTKSGQRWERHYVAGKDAPGFQKLEGIAWVNDSRVVVVGYGGGAVSWYSDDQGKTWTAGTGLVGGNDAKVVVQAPDGTIWALGPGAAWTSTDGAAWSPADGSAFADGYAFGAVPYGDTVIAVGAAGLGGSRDAAAWLLKNGTWNSVQLPGSTMEGDQYLHDIDFDPDTGGIVAVGVDATNLNKQRALVWTSENGTTWLSRTIPGGANDGLNSVLFYSGSSHRRPTFIAGGWDGSGPDSNASVWYSSDGSRWTRQPPSNATYQLEGLGAQSIRALVPYGPGGIDVYAFGVSGIGKTGKARLWRGGLT
jgi:hypothetical protein